MFNVIKAGNSLGVNKCCICWVAKENGGKKRKNPTKQTLEKIAKV